MRFSHTLAACLLLGIQLLTAVPLSTSAQSVESSVYGDAIVALSAAGVIQGGGNVRLHDYVNRVEALKVILKAQQRYNAEIDRTAAGMPPLNLFPDVKQEEWYAPYIEVGFKYGLIKGYPDGRFWPNGGVRTAEAASMLVRAYGLKNQAGFQTSEDLQNEEGQWYSDALSILNARGAITPGSRLTAGDYLTRGQLINMVYRMQLGATTSPQAVAGQTPVLSVNGSSTTTVNTAATSAIAPSGNPALAAYMSKKNFAITIPSLGIVDLTITHPSDPYSQKGVLAVLQDGVGHLFSYPGQGGKIMIYGHSSGYPWDLSKYTKIFRTINEIKVGDRVYVTYSGKLHVYQVSEKKSVPAKDTAAFEPDEHGEELVLYTCWPPDSITNRYLVHAVPVETVALK